MNPNFANKLLSLAQDPDCPDNLKPLLNRIAADDAWVHLHIEEDGHIWSPQVPEDKLHCLDLSDPEYIDYELLHRKASEVCSNHHSLSPDLVDKYDLINQWWKAFLLLSDPDYAPSVFDVIRLSKEDSALYRHIFFDLSSDVLSFNYQNHNIKLKVGGTGKFVLDTSRFDDCIVESFDINDDYACVLINEAFQDTDGGTDYRYHGLLVLLADPE